MLYQLSYAGFFDWINETFDNNQRRDGVSSFALSHIALEQTSASAVLLCVLDCLEERNAGESRLPREVELAHRVFSSAAACVRDSSRPGAAQLDRVSKVR
jgi:hypothetical protein